MSNPPKDLKQDRDHTLLFWASFATLIAAGIGFAVRGAIFGDWESQFGFTKTELGTITGGGLVGFGITIIFFSFFADFLGYKPLMVLAFVLHILSAVVTLAATPIYESMKANPESAKMATYWCLYIGAFLFALGNGVCEAVINPLTATLFPKQKTHYLNILHAGWPGGLIIGGLLAYCFCGNDAAISHLRWEIPVAFFLLPTLFYGVIMLREEFPESEAKAAGLTTRDMLMEFAAPVLLFLFVLHALVGYVELGTDSWITNIMDNVIPGKAILLFVYTSGLMFILRFFAGPIVERINPIGLLLVSAILGCCGLLWLSNANDYLPIILAATTYGIGKTFLWPTMLGVVGERFPKGGALTMGTIGGIGMLSAGLLGGPVIGYLQDYFAAQNLEAKDKAAYVQYAAKEASSPLPFLPQVKGLDGAKVGDVVRKKEADLTDADKKVLEARLYGGRQALLYTAAVPAMMAVGYLILLAYFQMTGGYKQEHLESDKDYPGEKYTGGVEGPVE